MSFFMTTTMKNKAVMCGGEQYVPFKVEEREREIVFKVWSPNDPHPKVVKRHDVIVHYKSLKTGRVFQKKVSKLVDCISEPLMLIETATSDGFFPKFEKEEYEQF